MAEIKTTANNQKKKTRIGKITTVLMGAVFLVVVVAVISLAIQAIGGKKPSIFGYRLYYVLTDSMEPELMVNDVILSDVIQSGEDAKTRVKEGDNITFTAEYGSTKGLVITHKVIKAPYFDETLGRYVVLTKGVKTGATIDQPVPVENIHGIMVSNLSFFTKLYKFILSPTGLMLLVILPFTALLGTLLYRLVLILQKTKPVVVSEERAEEIKADIAKQAVEEFIAKQEQEKRIEALKKQAIAEYLEKQEKKEQ